MQRAAGCHPHALSVLMSIVPLGMEMPSVVEWGGLDDAKLNHLDHACMSQTRLPQLRTGR